VTAKGEITADTKSHVWGSSKANAPSAKIPAYTDSQITGLADDAKAVKSSVISADALGAGALQGYYYSYDGYNYLAKQSNPATLKLKAHTNYTLDGTMFVAGKLEINDRVTITGEGRIIVAEDILFRKKSKFLGTTVDAHSDIVSLHGNVTIRHNSLLGQVASSIKGRQSDHDDDNDTDDDHCKFGLDDALWADKRDSDVVGCAAAAGGDKDKDKDKGKDKIKKKSADLKYGKWWKKKYKGAIPVGCTLFAPKGNVKLSKHTTLMGNIVAGGTVAMHNHSDVVRNVDDLVQSVGIFSWKSTVVRTTN